jgi:hypothetical protein
MFSGVVCGLDEDEASVEVLLSTQTTYRGDIIGIRVIFESNYPSLLAIYNVGIHFDWMFEDSFVGHDLEDTPAVIPAYGSYTFDLLTLEIPHTAVDGEHTYYVGIDGLQGENTGFSWDSEMLTFTVQGNATEFYSNLLTEVSNNITEAKNKNYESSEAQSLIQEAENGYVQAVSSNAKNNTFNAINELETSAFYLAQVDEAEQSYVETRNLLIVGGLVAVVAVVAVVFVLKRKPKRGRRRKK